MVRWNTRFNSARSSRYNCYTKKWPVLKQLDQQKVQAELVGTSIGASAAPSLSTIPYIGWVAAGWVAMFGGDQGADIGGNMAEDLNKNC